MSNSLRKTITSQPPHLTRGYDDMIPLLTRSINTSMTQQLEPETQPMMLRTRRIEYDYNLTEEENSLRSLLSNMEKTYSHEVVSLSKAKILKN